MDASHDKQQLIAMLKEEFNQWDELLSSLSEEQVTAELAAAELPAKDVVVHLWAWQQVSVARMEAALHNMEPQYPKWSDPGEEANSQASSIITDPDADVDQANASIYDTYKDKPWPTVYSDWREQFLHIIKLAGEIDEDDLLELGRYSWLDEYALSDVILGTYEHHEEHLELLRALLTPS